MVETSNSRGKSAVVDQDPKNGDIVGHGTSLFRKDEIDTSQIFCQLGSACIQSLHQVRAYHKLYTPANQQT